MGNNTNIQISIADKVRLIQAAKKRELLLQAAQNKGSISAAAKVRWMNAGVGR